MEFPPLSRHSFLTSILHLIRCMPAQRCHVVTSSSTMLLGVCKGTQHQYMSPAVSARIWTFPARARMTACAHMPHPVLAPLHISGVLSLRLICKGESVLSLIAHSTPGASDRRCSRHCSRTTTQNEQKPDAAAVLCCLSQGCNAITDMFERVSRSRLLTTFKGQVACASDYRFASCRQSQNSC